MSLAQKWRSSCFQTSSTSSQQNSAGFLTTADISRFNFRFAPNARFYVIKMRASTYGRKTNAMKKFSIAQTTLPRSLCFDQRIRGEKNPPVRLFVTRLGETQRFHYTPGPARGKSRPNPIAPTPSATHVTIKMSISCFIFRCDISVICLTVVLKLAVTVFIILYFQTFWPNWLNFFGNFKNIPVYDGKKQTHRTEAGCMTDVTKVQGKCSSNNRMQCWTVRWELQQETYSSVIRSKSIRRTYLVVKTRIGVISASGLIRRSCGGHVIRRLALAGQICPEQGLKYLLDASDINTRVGSKNAKRGR